jgi:hypothetical protein
MKEPAMNRPQDRPESNGRRQPADSHPQAQPGAGVDKEHGEGNYKATRDYDRGVKEHLRTHDVEREARDAAPRSEEEAREMQRAEELGKKKAEGMKDPKDRMDDAPGEGRVK